MNQLVRKFVDVECPDCGITLEVECAVDLDVPALQTCECPICDEEIQFHA